MNTLHSTDGWACYCERKLLSYSDSAKLKGRLQTKRKLINIRVSRVLEWISLKPLDTSPTEQEIASFYTALSNCKVMTRENFNTKGGLILMRCLEKAIAAHNWQRTSQFVDQWPHLITEQTFRMALEHDAPLLEKLLELLPPWQQESFQNEAFYSACTTGNLKLLHLLLNRGMSPYCQLESEKIPLEVAVEHGHLEMTLALIAKGALLQDKKLNRIAKKAGDRGWEEVAYRIIVSRASGNQIKIVSDLCRLNLKDYAFHLIQGGVSIDEVAFNNALLHKMELIISIAIQQMGKFQKATMTYFNETLFSSLEQAYLYSHERAIKLILAHDPNPLSREQREKLLKGLIKSPLHFREHITREYDRNQPEDSSAFIELFNPSRLRPPQDSYGFLLKAIAEWCEEKQLQLPVSNWIYDAVKHWCTPLLKLLLEPLTHEQVRDLANKKNLLSHALQRGDEEMVAFLLQAGAQFSENLQQNLYEAIEGGLLECAQNFLTQFSKEDLTKYQTEFSIEKSISRAYYHGHLSLATRLIQIFLLDTSPRERYGMLCYPAAYGDEVSIKLLLDHADLQERRFCFSSTKCIVTKEEEESKTSSSTQLHRVSYEYHNAYKHAHSRSHLGVIRTMIHHTLDTPEAFFDYVSENFFIEIMSIADEEFATMLLEDIPQPFKNKQLIACDPDGNTALMLAIEKGFDTLASRLLLEERDLERRNHRGHTLFSLAHIHGKEELKQQLLQRALQHYKELPTGFIMQKIGAPFFGMEEYKEYSLTDFTIIVRNSSVQDEIGDIVNDGYEEKRFPVCLALLAAKSPYFASLQGSHSQQGVMFRESVDKACIFNDQIQPQSMEKLLRYLYTQEIVITYDTFKELFAYSKMWMIPELEELLTEWALHRPECANWIIENGKIGNPHC